MTDFFKDWANLYNEINCLQYILIEHKICTFIKNFNKVLNYVDLLYIFCHLLQTIFFCAIKMSLLFNFQFVFYSAVSTLKYGFYEFTS